MALQHASSFSSGITAEASYDPALVTGATWSEQLSNVITALCQVRGDGGGRADNGKGRVLPLATAEDCLAVLAGMVNGVKTAIRNAQDAFEDRVPNMLYDSNGDGIFDTDANKGVAEIKTTDLMDSISIDAYLAGIPEANNPSKRSPLANLLYKFWPMTYNDSLTSNLLGNNTDHGIPQVRQLVDDYQRAVNQVSAAIGTYPTQTLPADVCSATFGPLAALAAGLDTLREFVPPTMWQSIQGGASAALKASEATVQDAANLAGKAAAETANVTGKGLGEFFSGFLSNSTALALVVAGAAVYYYK